MTPEMRWRDLRLEGVLITVFLWEEPIAARYGLSKGHRGAPRALTIEEHDVMVTLYDTQK